MKKSDRIAEYVAKLFDRYEMNDYGFFRDFDEESEQTVVIPLFRNGKIDDETITKVSIKFGISKDAVLMMDENAGVLYWNKYPFFSLYKKYLHAVEWNRKYKDKEPTPKELLINAIFSDKRGIAVRYRYDAASIMERLINQLKKYDEILPGTYHNGATITNLKILTETVFSFPECSEMLRSFLDMVNNLKILFFKAINEPLSTEEANELNFLANWLDARDIIASNTLVTYDTVRRWRGVYKEENYNDFYEYVVIRSFIDNEPWRCMEFFDEYALIEQFVYVFPQAKAKMRDFGMKLTKIYCDFVWSDAKPICFSDEEEKELADCDEALGQEPIPIEKRSKEHTNIYIEKNRSELYGWGAYIKALKKAYRPECKGGLKVPFRIQYPLMCDGGFQRLSKRYDANDGSDANG